MRRIGLAVVGVASGLLAGTGVGVVLLQSGRLDPSIAFVAPVIGAAAGIAVGTAPLARPVARTVTVLLLVAMVAVAVVGFSPPAAARQQCQVVVGGDLVPTDLATTTADDPMILDLSRVETLDVVVAAPGVATGRATVTPVAVHPFGTLGNTGPGPDSVAISQEIEGGSATITLTVSRSGSTGFVVEAPGMKRSVLPLGLLEVGVSVTGPSGVARCTPITGWVRIVARPGSNPTGMAGMAMAAVGMLGLIGTATVRRRLTAQSHRRSGPIPQDGPHASYLESRFVDARGRAIPADRPLVVGRDATLRVALRPAASRTRRLKAVPPGSAPLHITVSATAIDVPAVPAALIAGRRGSVDVPVRPRRPGRIALTVDVTWSGHLMHSERIMLTVVPPERRKRRAVMRQGTRTVFSASDFSAGDLGQRTPRSLLIVIERDASDGSIDARALDAAGKVLVRLDTLAQPQAVTSSAAVARSQLHAVLQAGPGRLRDVRADEIRATLLPLVKVGRSLYEALFAGETLIEGDADAVTALITDGAIVQVVQNRAAAGFSTLPWHLVYDHPFIARTMGNELCATFRQHPVDACPHRPDPNVFCPTGFWGYRAVVEEPWVVMGSEPLVPMTREVSPTAEPVPATAAPFGPGGGVGAGYHLPGLSFTPVGISAFEAAGLTSITDFGHLLSLMESEAARLELLYFYTVHERDPLDQAPGIVVGARRLSAGTFDALPTPWERRPLVMINGCASGDYLLTDPVTLLDRFRAKGAAGMVVTECVMWDRLAGELGAEIIDQLLAGGELGRVLLALRRRLLVEHGNPVAMAYRLHALSETRLVPNRP